MTKIIVEDPKALAALKLSGNSLDSLERKLVPSVDRTLFMVVGFTGRHELGTYRFWPVRCFRLEERAEEYCSACSKHAKEWEHQRDSYTQSPPYGWSQLDPSMRMSYEGTYYITYKVPIEMRPDDILTAADTCPICGTQVNATSLGYICENGHEL